MQVKTEHRMATGERMVMLWTADLLVVTKCMTGKRIFAYDSRGCSSPPWQGELAGRVMAAGDAVLVGACLLTSQ